MKEPETCPDCASEVQRLDDGTWTCAFCNFFEVDMNYDPYIVNEFGFEEE